MSSPKPIKIDVAKVLKEKAPKTKVPKFIVNYLRKIVHEEEFNNFFKRTPDKKNIEFMEASFKFLEVSASIQGKENLPHGSTYIFASNHPLGGLDGVALGYVLGKEYENKIKFISNDLLMNLEPLKEIFVPVNKVGKQSKNMASAMSELYNSDNHLVTFPAGICSRKIKGEICDLEWKKSFIAKSVEFQRDIVPIYFEGQNSAFFYNLARLRKFLGIKINIEMMYLADEMFKQKGNHFNIHIGKPIPWQTFDKSKSQAQWAQWVKDIVYSMKK